MAFPHLEELLAQEVYGCAAATKDSLLLAAIREVSRHHFDNCGPYQKLCVKRGFDPDAMHRLEEMPYLPTALFKDTLLMSIPEASVFRTISSSSTTSGRPSRIALDRETSRRQTKCFNKVALERLGNRRRSFIVLDTPESVGRSTQVSARSSTIRSLMFCAGETHTCLDESGGRLSFDAERFHSLVSAMQERDEEIVLFGFTYILYTVVVRRLLEEGRRYRLPTSRVLHIGGWKKLEAEKVTPERLVSDCAELFGVDPGNVVDFYGFTEQAGMLYPTCESGYRHVPTWGAVIVRDPLTLEPLDAGKEGLLQFISPIQTSYPGHSVLTEDLGRIVGTDACSCGRKGSFFELLGRAPQAEVRGCGDIMAGKMA